MTKLQHRSKAQANTARIIKTNTAKKVMCVWQIGKSLRLLFVLCSLFSCLPWSSIVLLLFAVMGVRNDLVSVIIAFLQGTMSVRSERFSVSGWIKNSWHSSDPRICSLHFKESNIEISISGRKSLRSGCYPTSLTQRSWRIRLVCVQSILPIGRDSVMNNCKPRKFAPETSILRTP